MAPGTLIHIGENRTENVSYGKITYDQNECAESSPTSLEELYDIQNNNKVHWININGVHQTDKIETLGKYFNLHPLVLEDIVNTEQRPKIEDYGDYIFVVIKMLSFDDKSKEVSSEQVSLILGNNYVISFQERKGDVFDHLRERLRKEKTKFRKSGADYLFYSLIDAVVDHYFLILEKLGDHIEDIEEAVSSSDDENTVREIYALKREILMLRKSIWPLREIVNSIQKSIFPLFKKSTLPYFRDIYDHTVQVIETVESYRDLSSSILDMHMTIVSNRMNEIMKVLTIIATIFIPLTFVAGIYGMNFKYMPELDWKSGYPLALGVMGIIAVIMLIFFKRKKWL